MSLPENHLLAKEIEKWKKYKGSFIAQLLERMKVEGLLKDKEFKREYSARPAEYGMKKLRYHECFKCKRPFFAGKKECIEAENEQKKEEDYICYSCGFKGEGMTKCKKHGIDFIIFKCKFCCSLSEWFCW